MARDQLHQSGVRFGMNGDHTAVAAQRTMSAWRPGPALSVLMALFALGVVSLIYGGTNDSVEIFDV